MGEGTEGSKPSSPSFWSDEVLNIPVPVHGMTGSYGEEGEVMRAMPSPKQALFF